MTEIHLVLGEAYDEEEADVTVRGDGNDPSEFLEYVDSKTLLQRVLKEELEDAPFDSVTVEPRSGLEGFSAEE